MQETTKEITSEDKMSNNSSHNPHHHTTKKSHGINNSIAIIIGAIIIASSIIFTNMYKSAGNASFVDPDSLFAGKELNKNEFYSGKPGDKIVLLEYSDLECPFCKKFHNETMVKIRDTYKDKVAIAYRHFPLDFHKKAPKEAEAALCVRDQLGQSAYFKFMSRVFEITPSNDALDHALLPDIAKYAGVTDIQAWQKCLDSGEKSKEVTDDLQDGLSVGVQGTPNTFVLLKQSDGKYKILTLINGARDEKYVKSVLDQAIKMSK